MCARRDTFPWRCNMRSFILAVSIAFIWALLAAHVGYLAEKKGHSGNFWNVLSLVCSPLIGYLLVILLPSAPDFVPLAYRPCPHCSRTIKARIEVCPYCDTEISRKPSVNKIAA